MIIAIPTNNSGDKVLQRSQNAAYSEYVSSAGFTPILVPMEASSEEIANISDGLLLAGGVDIDPLYYGVNNNASFYVDPSKDAHERELLHAFRTKGKPVFGICRGFQLMFREFMYETNYVYRKYLRYMENINGHAQSNDLNVKRCVPTHLVRTNTSSLYSTDNGPNFTTLPVNSLHHQAVVVNFIKSAVDFGNININQVNTDEPSVTTLDNFELLAWSLRGVTQPVVNKKPDLVNYWAIVEAAKIHNWGGTVMGVQWHPEELKDTALIKNFFESEVVDETTATNIANL